MGYFYFFSKYVILIPIVANIYTENYYYLRIEIVL